MSPYEWSWNLEALILVPLLTIAYLLATRHLATPPWRKACFVAAMLLLLAITITPFETIALKYLLWVHLLQNVALAEWAPLLIVLGISPALACHLARPRLVRAVTHPLLALPLWVGNYALWHVPLVYDAALRHPHSLLHLEHATYVVTGVAVWWPVFQDVPRAWATGARAVYVFAAFVLAAPIGLGLTLLPEPVYDFYVAAPRLWGLSPLADQQLGGVSMAAEQAVVFFAIFGFLFLRFLAEQDRADESDLGLEQR